MTNKELDILWGRALRDSVAAGEMYTRYRFAALVAAAEREECAEVCEAISTDKWALYKGRPPYTGQELGRAADFTLGQSDGAELCEQAIRARGNP